MKKQVVVLLSMALAISTLGNKAVVFANDVAVTDTKITTEKSEINPYLFDQETENNNISFDFKDGVLTVSGTGCIGENYTGLCKKKEIKEVIIKSGVSAIGDYAFRDCKKLKKITISNTVTKIGFSALESTGINELVIPASVKKIGTYGFYACDNLKNITMPGNFEIIENEEYEEYDYNVIMKRVDEIHFNSEFDPNNMCSFDANKIYTWKNDTKYKSYKGIVYTKNAKKLVMVPAGTENLKIRKGCKTISMNSFMYAYKVQGDYYPYCNELISFTIPESVKKIVDDVVEYSGYSVLEDCKLKINSKYLTGKSIENLSKIVDKKTRKELLTSSRYKIKKINGMYITKDNVLLCYEGKNANVTIPSNVKRIGDFAFCGNTYIKKVKLSEKLKTIGECAFSGCKNLSEISWGKKVTTVDNSAFQGTNLKKMTLPASVKSWGEECFANSSLEKVTFSKTINEIPKGMFRTAKLKKVVIPVTVKKIGEWSFAGNYKIKSVTLKKGVETICTGAFDECNTIDSVVVSKSVKNIEKYAFVDTTIKKLVLKGSNTVFANNALYKVEKCVYDTTAEKYATYLRMEMINGVTNETELYVVKVEGASGLEISFAKTSDFSDEVINIIANKSGSVIFKLPDDMYNKYRIRPYTNVNGEKIYGQWREYSW